MTAEPGAAVVYSHRVRYHETDAQRFVFNSRFLEFADVAMTEFFRKLGWTYPELLDLGFDPSLVTSTQDFTHPARLDDLLQIAVTCDRVGTSSFTLRFTMSTTEALVCTVVTSYVNVDLATSRPTPIPADIAEALRTRASADGAVRA